MSHPPIPPNCPYFRDDGDDQGAWFETPTSIYSADEGSNTDGPFLEDCGDWRPIIAAVACCGWAKEMGRMIRSNDGPNPSEKYDNDAMMRVGNNIDRWTLWGEQK